MQGFVRANHWGISASHSSTLKKLDEMGDNFDDKVKTWKSELEKNHLISEMLGIVDEYVKARDKEQIPEGLQTTDVSSLSLTFPESPADVPNTEYSEHESQSTNSDLPSMEDFSDKKITERSGSRRKICQERIKESLWDQGNHIIDKWIISELQPSELPCGK